MRYRLPVRDPISRTEKRNRIIKCSILIVLMLMFYTLMRVGIFNRWQPVFIIPLTVAVAMYESEMTACVFSLFGGYMIDIACGYIFGFSAVWLMTVGVAASLFVRNLIRVNIVNFMIITAAAVAAEFSMDYLFNVFIWNIEHSEVIVKATILPSAASTVIVSPAVYYLVRTVERRLGADNIDIINYSEPASEEKSDEE